MPSAPITVDTCVLVSTTPAIFGAIVKTGLRSSKTLSAGRADVKNVGERWYDTHS
jgi:hypothetical protein